MDERKLIVKQDYQSREHHFKVGDVINVSDALANWFIADAPLAFADYEDQKGLVMPPADKMVRRPKEKEIMAIEQVYANVKELSDDIGGVPNEDAAYGYIRAASQFIKRKLFGWNWIPITETRKFDGNGQRELNIDLLVGTPTVTVDGTLITSTQYNLSPANRHWEDGPYSRLVIDDDASQLSVWLKESQSVVVVGPWGAYNKTENLAVTGSQSDTDTTIVPSDYTKISPGMILYIGTEQELVTGTSFHHVDVKRGINGTTAATHSTATIYQQVVPYDVNWLCRQIAGLMLKKAQTGFAGKTGDAALGEVFYNNEFPGDPIKQIKDNYRITRL